MLLDLRLLFAYSRGTSTSQPWVAVLERRPTLDWLPVSLGAGKTAAGAETPWWLRRLYWRNHVLPLTKRQREILDYLNEFIQQHGYAPSLEEIGRRFNLSSLATVHKHLTNLQEKGFIRRAWNRSRSVELVPTRVGSRALELPLLGFVAAGVPIEAVASNETIAVPEGLVGKRDSYVLRVKGDSMIDEQIRDGDYVIVEDRKSADNGEMVIALVGGLDVTLKKFYRENGRVRLQPANPAMQPLFVDADRVQVQGVVVGVMRRY